MPNTNIKRKRRALGQKTCGGPTKYGKPGFTSSRVEFKVDFSKAKSKAPANTIASPCDNGGTANGRDNRF